MTEGQLVDLSRLDAFRQCSRDFLCDKGQFCFIRQKICNWNRPLSSFLNVSQCTNVISNIFTQYYRAPLLIVYSKPSKLTIAKKLLKKPIIPTIETYSRLGLLVSQCSPTKLKKFDTSIKQCR